MADIPQEVREGAYQIVAEMLEYFDGHKLATWAPLASIIERERNAMFLAGKRAGAEEEKRHQDFVTATAYECGHKAGMERAAAWLREQDGCGEWAEAADLIEQEFAIAQAIRSENDGHG